MEQSGFDIRTFFKRWPKFYYFMMLVFGPALFTGLSSSQFLRRYPSNGRILNLGSGPRVLGPDVVNVDLFQFEGVSIVADVTAVPLPPGSVSRIVSDNVLEHVADPAKAVSEMRRLLEPGGLAYVAAPFLYPFHSSPSDYQRWTAEGFKQLFKDFDVVEVGVRAGPFSALLAYLSHGAGFLFSFGSPTLNSLITNGSLLVLFPIKFLDIVFSRFPNAHMMAAILYCVVRKR